MQKLSASFYEEGDVCLVAERLLGKLLATRSLDGAHTIGRITEVEAYGGLTDKASHAYGGRRTARTKVMFGRGGYAYVYLCYGIHHLFNVVSGEVGEADAVLVRSIEPLLGEELMRKRRQLPTSSSRPLCAGPGTLSQSLGIHTSLSGLSLQGNRVWIADDGYRCAAQRIQKTPRIGIDYAEEDAQRLWRFVYIA